MSFAEILFEIVRCILSFQGYTLNCIWPVVNRLKFLYQPDSLNVMGDTVDYTNKHYRNAYLYSLFVPHVFHVRTILSYAYNLSQEAQLALQRISTLPRINMTSVGGGPGPELFGFILFLVGLKSRSNVLFSNLDRCLEWQDVMRNFWKWFNIANLNEDVFIEESNYIEFDLWKDLSGPALESLRNADVLTMIKFYSAAAFQMVAGMVAEDGSGDAKLRAMPEKDRKRLFQRYSGVAMSRLGKMFRMMKPGAVLLYVDNKAGFHCGVIQMAAESEGLLCIYKRDFLKSEIPDFNSGVDLLKRAGWATQDKSPLKYLNTTAELYLKV